MRERITNVILRIINKKHLERENKKLICVHCHKIVNDQVNFNAGLYAENHEQRTQSFVTMVYPLLQSQICSLPVIIISLYARFIIRLLLLYLRTRDIRNSSRLVYNNPLQSSYFIAVLRREIKRKRYVSRTPAFRSINPSRISVCLCPV